MSLTRTLIFTLPLPDMTGAARMALAFARGFVNQGYSVRLLHGSVRVGHERILQDFRSVGADLCYNPSFGRALHLSVFRWIYEELKRTKPVAVVSTFVTTDTKYVGPACRILGIPHIASVQNDIVLSGNALTQRLKTLIFQAIYRSSVDLAVCTSERIRATLLHNYGLPAQRLAVLPNAIDVSHFEKPQTASRQRIRREFGLREDQKLLVSVGRLHPQKGHDVLVEALNKLPLDVQSQIVLLLVGDVDFSNQESVAMGKRLKQQVSDSGLDAVVRFVGLRDDVRELLSACDLYAHSARWEGFPLAVLEALASALPVVINDCAGDLSGFVNGTHGYCVTAEQPSELAEALEMMLAHAPSQRSRMGQNCRRLVQQNYDIAVIGKQFIQLLERTANRP